VAAKRRKKDGRFAEEGPDVSGREGSAAGAGAVVVAVCRNRGHGLTLQNVTPSALMEKKSKVVREGACNQRRKARNSTLGLFKQG
jgi:hypothetical protein